MYLSNHVTPYFLSKEAAEVRNGISEGSKGDFEVSRCALVTMDGGDLQVRCFVLN